MRHPKDKDKKTKPGREASQAATAKSRNDRRPQGKFFQYVAGTRRSQSDTLVADALHALVDEVDEVDAIDKVDEADYDSDVCREYR